jgi:glycosyltransferase involved in cell wall biosynthesis
MKILVVMLYWYPYEGPLQAIYGPVFKHLMAKGHKITIVASFPHYRKGCPETWDEFKGKLFEESDWKGATLIRSYVFAPIFRSRKLSLLSRALNFISFNISCMYAAIFMTGKQDLIFAPSSPPLTNGICAHLIGLFKKAPFVYNVQDIYPDMAVKLDIINNKIVINTLRYIEDFVYRKAKRLLVISDAMKNNLLLKNVKQDKILIISNFIDTDFIKPLNRDNVFSSRFGLNNKFVVLYAGNVGLPHGIEFVIESAEMLKENRDIVFVFVSRGEHKDKVISKCKSKNLKNVIFLPQQPEHMVPKIWASAEISLVTSRKGLSTYSVPSKTFAIMASGHPVLAMIDENSEVWDLVKKSKSGICVPPERPDILSDAILRLYENNIERNNMGKNGRNYVLNHYSRKIISQKYEDVFENLLK